MSQAISDELIKLIAIMVAVVAILGGLYLFFDRVVIPFFQNSNTFKLILTLI